MKTVIVGFSAPKKWKPFSWLIQTAYKIPYDHVYIQCHSDEMNLDFIFQASSTMVNFMSTTQFTNENKSLFEFPIQMTDENYKAMMQFAFQTAGTPYGVKECFGLAYVKLMSFIGKTVQNPFRDDTTTYVCSELCAYILQQYDGMKLPKDPADMTPLDVYNFMLTLKNQ